NWVREMEKIFRSIRCPEEEFLAAFREKFFPRHVQEGMMQDFLTLTQGSMSVMEYEFRFSELEKFAPHICVNEAMRASKFVRGLKGSLRGRVVSQDPQTMAAVVRGACLQEIEQARYQEERKVSQKTYSASASSQDRKRKQRPSAAVPSGQRQATVP